MNNGTKKKTYVHKINKERTKITVYETNNNYKKVLVENPITHRFHEETVTVSSEEKEVRVFPLREISREEIFILYESGVPGFVLKEHGKFYYAEIKRNTKIESSMLGKHLCANCQHLSSASDEEGGCIKVRSLSKGIERFDFISFGFETFNTRSDSFIVFSCSNFEDDHPRPKVPRERPALYGFLD